MKKTVIVNYVARHSHAFVIKMVAGLSHNNCKVFAIVSKNMPEIDKWRKLKNVELYEVDGYTRAVSFPVKLLKFYVTDAFRIWRRTHEIGATVIYIPIASYWSCFINCIRRDLPFVFTLHDPVAHDRSMLIIRAFNYLLGLKANKVVILSDIFRDYVKKHYKKKKEEIFTIPSGNESMSVKNNRKEIICYDDSKVNFVFQGQIAKYKGLKILAAAYAKLRRKYNNVTLTVAGFGDFSEYERVYSKLYDCMVINRWLTDEEVAGLFNDRSVIAVLPYLSATQSGVINVAMPNGAPIIATKCGGIIEQIVDNETGYLIEPNNVEALYEKMEYVVNHREDWARIRENAYKRMKSLDWDVLSGKLAEIL